MIFIEIFLVLIFGSFPILEIHFFSLRKLFMVSDKMNIQIFSFFTFHKILKIRPQNSLTWRCQIFVTNLWQMCYRNTWYVASLFKPSVVDYGFGWYLPLTRLIYQMVQKILPELRKLRKMPVTRKFRVEKNNFRFSRYSCNKYPKFFDFTHVTMLNIL